MDKENFKISIDTPDPGYEPFPVFIMNRFTYEATTFDPSLGKPATISYRLNKSGCIRIRIVHRNQTDMLIRTLQDWTQQDFGKYNIPWDGRDSSGNIVDNKKVLVLFESKDKDNGLQHQKHDESTCRDPMLVIMTQPDSRELVSGMFEMITTFPGEANPWEHSDALEVRYYVDYKLFQKERVVPEIKKFVFKMDTACMENGSHLITVIIDDLHDHIGSAGVKINVENRERR